jgi:hypothetical protein
LNKTRTTVRRSNPVFLNVVNYVVILFLSAYKQTIQCPGQAITKFRKESSVGGVSPEASGKSSMSHFSLASLL